jgi:hypothetical protein
MRVAKERAYSDSNKLHLPFSQAIGVLQRPLLVTTVDAEESFDWAQPLSRHFRDLKAIAQQPLAHKIFDRYGVTPIYLVTHPVATQPDGYRPLLELFQSRKCEVGAQLHPWVNPPFEEIPSVENSFAGNLPASLEFDKLRILTDAISERFQQAPTVYRAGRYGFGPNTYNALRKLGYRIDTSIVPEQSYRPEGGPSFFGMPVWPYWATPDQTVLELPLTCAFVGMVARLDLRLARRLYENDQYYRLVRGALARGRLLERIRLTPEGIRVGEAKTLVRVLRAQGLSLFVLSYHSSSLQVGNTPYVRTTDERDQLLRWLDEFYQFFFGEIGGAPATMSDVYDVVTRIKDLPLDAQSERLERTRTEHP